MIDLSARARVVGIGATYKDLRTASAGVLPQRIALFAQGSSSVTYPTTKWPVTSAAAAAARFGYGSPIHLALRELLPLDGDGVGSIPITVYPLAEAGGATAATGSITPSGTPTAAVPRRVRVGGYLSQEFTIALGALATAANLTAACRKIGEAIRSILYMPVDVAYTYGAVAAGTLSGGTGNGTIGTFTTTGNPKPGTWRVECTSAVANGGVFKATDPDGQVYSGLTLSVGSGAATALTAGGLGFTITDGVTDFGVGAGWDVTVPATAVGVTSKWKGTSANAIQLEIVQEAAYGLTFAITQPTGGATNPTLDSALGQVGDVWETLALNALDVEDTVALDALAAFNEGRWLDAVHKPLVAFVGNTKTLVGDATAICSTRQTDRTNCQLVAPGSSSLPFVVAARQLSRIARLAQNDPAHDYGSQRATGLVPGTDGSQWPWLTRDQAVKLGSSTIEVRDGIVTMSDTVTFYRPTGEAPPAYSHVCDIIKLQQLIYNLNQRFNTTEWDGAPLIPDGQTTSNPNAKTPAMAKAEVSGVVEGLAELAVLADPDAIKATIDASIDANNPKRLNVAFTAKIAGNANIIDVPFTWGFNFGAAAA